MDKRRIAGTMKPQGFMDVISKQTRQSFSPPFHPTRSTKFSGKSYKDLEEMGFWSYTLPETNSSHLKMDGWNTIVSLWVSAHFQVIC